MRVALIAPFGLEPKGTTAARVLPIARVLAGRGAQVRVVIPPWDDPARAGQRWEENGYEIVHTRVGKGVFNPPTVLVDVVRRVREWRPDVVHAFKPIGYGGAAAWLLARNSPAAGRAREPLVVVDADDLEGPAGWAGRKRQGIEGVARGVQERATIKRAHRVTVASRWLAGYARQLGVQDSALRYLPNGQAVASETAADREESEMRPPRLLWYTRFTEARAERVADLVGPLLRADPTLRLLVVGDEVGSGQQAAARRAFEWVGLAGQIDWLGYRRQVLDRALACPPSTIAIYPLEDDLVNRARCPSKIPQLMALGIPIVAEAVGEAVTYLGTAADECLAAPGDGGAFRALAQRLLTDEPARLSLSQRLREASADWTWDEAAGGLLDWYADGLAKRAPAQMEAR
jgi:glycosyltransferase involved in cell wall biosynthesis